MQNAHVQCASRCRSESVEEEAEDDIVKLRYLMLSDAELEISTATNHCSCVPEDATC